MENIVVGLDRNENGEFYQFLSIAKRSCGETRSQLYRAFDNNYINQQKLDNLVSEYEKLCIKKQNFISYLNINDFKGTKNVNS